MAGKGNIGDIQRQAPAARSTQVKTTLLSRFFGTKQSNEPPKQVAEAFTPEMNMNPLANHSATPYDRSEYADVWGVTPRNVSLAWQPEPSHHTVTPEQEDAVKTDILSGKMFAPDGSLRSPEKREALVQLHTKMTQELGEANIRGLTDKPFGITRVGILTAWELKNAFNPGLSDNDFKAHLKAGAQFLEYLVGTPGVQPPSHDEAYLGFQWIQQALMGPQEVHRGLMSMDLGSAATERFVNFFKEADGNYMRASTHSNGTRLLEDGLGLDRPHLRGEAPVQSGNGLWLLTAKDPKERLIAIKMDQFVKGKASRQELDRFIKSTMGYGHLSREGKEKVDSMIAKIPDPKDLKIKDDMKRMIEICKVMDFETTIGTKYELHGFNAVGFLPKDAEAIHHMGIRKVKPKSHMDQDYRALMTTIDSKGKEKLAKTSNKEHLSTQKSYVNPQKLELELGLIPERTTPLMKQLVRDGILLKGSKGNYLVNPQFNPHDPTFEFGAEVKASLNEGQQSTLKGYLKKHPNLYSQIINSVNDHLREDGFGTASKIRRKDGALLEKIATHKGHKTSMTDVALALQEKAVRESDDAQRELLTQLADVKTAPEERDRLAQQLCHKEQSELVKTFVKIVMGYYALNPNESITNNREGNETHYSYRGAGSALVNGTSSTHIDEMAGLFPFARDETPA